MHCTAKHIVAVTLALVGLCATALGLALPPAAPQPTAVFTDVTSTLDLASAVELLEDPGGKLTLANVQAPDRSGAFQLAGNRGFSRGYSTSAWWARVRVLNTGPDDNPLLLRIGSPSLDDVQVFAPGRSESTQAWQSGALHGGDGREIDDTALVYRAWIPTGQIRTVWLRVASQSSPVTVPLALWRTSAFPRATADRVWLEGAVIGVCAALLLAILVIGMITRQTAPGWMILHMVGIAGTLISLGHVGSAASGSLGIWWARHDFVVMQLASVVGALLFSRGFLPGGPACRCAPVLTATTGVVAAVTTLAVAITEPWALALAQLVSAAAMLLLVAIAAQHVASGAREPRWLLAAWVFAAAAVWDATARRFGWIAANDASPLLSGYLEGADALLLAAGLADIQAQARRKLVVAERLTADAHDALQRERQSRVQTVLNDTPGPVVLVDSEGQIVFANTALCTLLGYKPGDLNGRPIEALVPMTSRAGHAAKRAKYSTNGSDTTPMLNRRDLAALRADGTELPVTVNLMPYAIDGVHYVLAAVQDVTEQRVAQDALRSSEQRFRTLADNLPGAVYRIRLGGEPVADYLSKGMEELFGRPAFLAGLDLPLPAEFVHPDDLHAYQQAVTRLEQLGEPMDLEHRIVRPDGSVRWVHNVAVLSRDPGRLTAYRDGRMIDITAKRQATDALDKQRSLLEAIIDSLDGALAVTDKDLRILNVNRRWESYRGVNRAQVLGKTFDELRTCGVLPDMAESVVRVETNGDMRVVELSLVRDGVQQAILSTVSPLRDHRGLLQGTCAYSIDVTAERQLQRDLATARDDALAASRSKSAFVANMSHEIRTPMNAVLGFADILSARLTDRELRSHAEVIASSGRALLTLIDDVLDLAKVEAGKLELRPVATHLPSLLADIERLMGPRARDKGLVLRLETGSQVPQTVVLDESRLRQVLLNLLSNAIKFTDIGQVAVKVARGTDATPLGASQPAASQPGTVSLLITVSDTGVGVPPDQQAKIFEAFEQTVGQEHGKYGGTGLGLSITRRIIELMGGHIAVQSEVGRGSAFTVCLDNVPVAQRQHSPASTSVAVALQFAPSTVLIVDDSLPNRIVFKEFLADTGLQVVEAGDGCEALAALAASSPGLVLTDLKMPNMGGEELVEQIRQDARWSALPVVVLTASGMTGSHAPIRDAVQGFLIKPVTRDTLVAELARHLPTLRPALPGPLELDRVSLGKAQSSQTPPATSASESEVPWATQLNDLVDLWRSLQGSGDLDGTALLAEKIVQYGRVRPNGAARRFGRRLARAATECALDDIDRAMRELELLYPEWQEHEPLAQEDA